MIHFNRILCPVDFSEFSDHALRYAMKLAASYRASLDVLHVVPPIDPASARRLSAIGRYLIRQNLESTVELLREPDVAITSEVVESDQVSEIIAKRADELDADVIVTGSHGRTGIERTMFGSVVEPLLDRSHHPVLVVPAHLDRSRLGRPVMLQHIICGIDFSTASLVALTYAMTIAEETGAKLTLVNVLEEPVESGSEQLARLRGLVPWLVRQFCVVEAVVIEGRASRQLVDLADRDRADLIVLGSHSRLVLDVSPATAPDIIARAHCPVLIVPAVRRRDTVRVPTKVRYGEPALVG